MVNYTRPIEIKWLLPIAIDLCGFLLLTFLYNSFYSLVYHIIYFTTSIIFLHFVCILYYVVFWLLFYYYYHITLYVFALVIVIQLLSCKLCSLELLLSSVLIFWQMKNSHKNAIYHKTVRPRSLFSSFLPTPTPSTSLPFLHLLTSLLPHYSARRSGEFCEVPPPCSCYWCFWWLLVVVAVFGPSQPATWSYHA